LIFAAEAAWTAISFFKRSVIHPVLTKKSLILTAITHLAAFCLVVLLYQMILGEMGLFDFSSGAFALLFFDLTTPLFVGLAVAILHPITVFEKNKILRKAEEARRARPDLFAIGIAGSYGKSITKELLAYVLLKKHRVLKTAANQNTEVGVSQVLINELKPEHEFFVCEIGAVHKGKIKSVADAVQPQAGILCGINQQHMAVFGNQQKIIDAKYEILEALPSNGAAILNWESKLIRESFESQKSRIKAQKIILAGKDIVVNDLKISIDRLTFKVKHADETAILDINARGAYFIEPILLAMAGALACKMNFQEIADILNKTDFTPFNIGLEKNSDGINILSSTYSANPNGVLAHLDYLKVWPGKKAIVMPCLIELGKSSKDVHRLIGKKIAGVCDFAVIVTRDRFGEIQKGAVLAGMKKEKIIFSEKPAVIKKIVTEILKPDGTLLLEGRLPQAIIEVLKS
jgi:UDP-N-acetylmuramoyl-tripeptide--D-alanyl-D-alanine ligase